MSKSLILSLLLLASVAVTSGVFAQELSIEGNAPGSTSTITINSGSTVTQSQQNSANISTTVNASAQTGGNSTSGNSGDSTIVTGDSSVEVRIKNILNSDLSQTDCCDPSPAPTPPPGIGGADPSDPTPTPFTTTTNTTQDNPGSSSSTSSSSPVGGGQVLGLPATSAADPLSALVSTLGLLCLSTTALILKSAIL